MIDNKKVKIMTNLAIYEKKNEEDLKISQYYKFDYIRFNIIKTILNVTLAYSLVFILVVLYNIENIIANVFDINYIEISLVIIISYFLSISVFCTLSYFIYSEKYNNAKQRILKYYKKLRTIEKMNNNDKRKK